MYGAISIVASGGSSTEKAFSANPSALVTNPYKNFNISVSSATPATGIYTVVPQLSAGTLTTNQAIVSVIDNYATASPATIARYFNTVSTQTISVTNNAGVITFSFTNLPLFKDASTTNTIVPNSITLTGSFTK